MGKEIVYTCDYPGCNQVRTPSNHWFMIADLLDQQRNNATSAADRLGHERIVVFAFDPDLDRKCYCGEDHALKAVAMLLAKLHPEPIASGDEFARIPV